jgi:two-component sensor histidine kinase
MAADQPRDREAFHRQSLSVCDPPNCNILKEADHRIANNLAQLASMLDLRLRAFNRDADAPTKEGVRQMMQSVRSGILATSRLHRLLASNCGRSPIDLGANLYELCAPLSELSGTSNLVEDLAQGCLVNGECMLPIGQIVVEAVTNAVKYGQPPACNRPILVACRQGPRGMVLVEIADCGPGLPHGFDPATDGGLGLSVMRALAAKMGATLGFNSSRSGLRVELGIPLGRPRLTCGTGRTKPHSSNRVSAS